MYLSDVQLFPLTQRPELKLCEISRMLSKRSFSVQVTKMILTTAGTDQNLLPSEDRLLLMEMGWTCSGLMSWWTDWCITKPKHLHCNWLPDRQPAQKTSQWVHTPSDKTISRWPQVLWDLLQYSFCFYNENAQGWKECYCGAGKSHLGWKVNQRLTRCSTLLC